MSKLHGFTRPMEPITEFDGSDEDVVPRQKPKYAARQLAMEGGESRIPDPPVENNTKNWPDSYDITVTVSTTSRLYKKYKWNEKRNPQIGGMNCQICEDVGRFLQRSSCGDIFAGWRPDGDVQQSEETYPGESLQHEDALVREFLHILEPENREKLQCLG